MDPAPKIEKHIITYMEKVLAIMVVVSGLVPLSGWLFHKPVLASLGEGFIPMAPSTALYFVFFGVLMLFFERTGKNAIVWRSGFIMILVSSLTAIVLLWFSFHSRYFHVETLGFSTTTLPNNLPTGHMSPLTAFCFLVTGLAFLTLLFNPEKSTVKAAMALGFSTILFLVTLNLLFAYLIGAPVFYDGNIIPPAVTTTVGFVFLGSGLMFFSGKQYAIESISLESYSRKTSLFLILVFIILAAGIVISGNFYFRSFEKNFKQQVGNNLISITELKIHQLTQWRNERLGDAEIIRHDEDFSELVASYLKDKNDRRIKTKLEKRLKLELEAYNYDAFSIFDINRQQQIAYPDINMERDSVLTKDIQTVLDNRKIFFRDFYKNLSDGGIYLQLLIPITDHSDTAKVIAVAALRINPHHYLYHGINEWPVVSQTAETSIVRKEGDSIVFLNDLRFIKNSALVFKWPLSDHELPAVRAVMGTRGVIEGTDYRNVPVLASVNAIGDSPWYIVDRIDISDVYEPLRERLRITVFMIS